jgi:hypothetical protein
MKHWIALLLLAGTAAMAQFNEDVIFYSGSNGTSAAEAAPGVFAADWSSSEFAPFRREWERLGRAKPRQFPCVWSAEANELVTWHDSYTNTVAIATAPERRPAYRRLRVLIGRRPTDENVQRALTDTRDAIAGSSNLPTVKTNTIQFLDILLAERAADAEAARK